MRSIYTGIYTYTQHSRTHCTQARDYGTQVGHTHPVLNPWVRWYASGAQACLILAEVISIVSVMHATSIAFDPCNNQTVSQLVSLPTPPTSEFALPNGMVLDVCHCMLHTLPIMIEPRVGSGATISLLGNGKEDTHPTAQFLFLLPFAISLPFAKKKRNTEKN